MARNRKDDGELGVGHLGRRFNPGGKLPDNYCTVLAAKNIVDLKFDRLRQHADLAKEVGGRLTPGFMSDPRQHAIVALDIEAEILCEHGSEGIGVFALTDAGKKLFGDLDIPVQTN